MDWLDVLDDAVEVPEPIVCSLTPEAIKAGRAGLLPGLAERAMTRKTTDDGYQLTFAHSSGTLREIMEVIDSERQCCRWLSFTLTVPASEGPVTLTLSGPPGAREFLEALFEH